MNTLSAYFLIIALLLVIFLRTTKIKSSEKEYFVLNKTEGVLGLSLSFYGVVDSYFSCRSSLVWFRL